MCNIESAAIIFSAFYCYTFCCYCLNLIAFILFNYFFLSHLDLNCFLFLKQLIYFIKVLHSFANWIIIYCYSLRSNYTNATFSFSLPFHFDCACNLLICLSIYTLNLNSLVSFFLISITLAVVETEKAFRFLFSFLKLVEFWF